MLGAIPGATWLLYFRWKSRRYSCSFDGVLRVFVWGCFCTIPAGIAEHLTGAGLRQDTLLTATSVAFFLIAPIEEISKLMAVWGSIYRSPDFRDPMHGILYSATAACAFVSVENVVYMTHLGPETLWLRLVFSTPAHVMFSSMWGYAMGVARFQRPREIATIAKGFLASVFFHGTYNFVVALNPKIAVLSLVPLLMLMAWVFRSMIVRFRRHHPFPSLGHGVVILCPNCGAFTMEDAAHCSRCGFSMPILEPDAERFCANCRTHVEPCGGKCSGCGENVHISDYCPQERLT